MSPRLAIRGAIGIAVSIAAVVLLLGTIDLSSAATRLAAVDPAWLLLAPIALAVQLGIRSRRWAFLLTTAATTPIRTVRVIGPLTVGYLANALLPARLGEVARSILVARREGLAFGLVVASVVVERALDLVALLLLGIATTGVAVIGWPAIVVVGLVVAGLAVGVAVAPALARWSDRRAPVRLRAPFGDFLRAISALGLRASAVATALSGVAWLGDVALVWVAARALGIEIDLPATIAIAVGAALGTALPAASGYIGTYEAGAVAIGSLAGTPPDVILAIAVVAHVLAVVPIALVGAVSVAGTGLPLTRSGDETAGPKRAAA